MKTGFIGLGAMGVGMAANLEKAGHLVSVWNRTHERAVTFAGEHGVAAADEPATVAAECDLVVTCVSRDEDVLAVIDQLLAGLSEGKVVADCSTVSVDTAKEAARRLAEVGAHFLDAPVSGGVEGARSGQLVMMVGGEESVLESVRPVLETMAKSVTYMGPVGSGQATKAVNQIMVAGINQAVTDALAFGQASGLDMDKVISVVGNGAAGNWFVNHRGPTMVRGLFEPGFKMALHHKDLAICKAMAEKMGVSLPVVEMTLHQYERLMDAGHGDDDISGLYRTKRDMFAKGNKKSL